WDLSPLYKSPNDPQLTQDFSEVRNWVQASKVKIDESPGSPDLWEKLTLEAEAISNLQEQMGCYIYNAWSLNTQDTIFEKLKWEYTVLSNEVSQIHAAFNSFLQTLSDSEFSEFKSRPSFKGLDFF